MALATGAGAPHVVTTPEEPHEAIDRSIVNFVLLAIWQGYSLAVVGRPPDPQYRVRHGLRIILVPVVHTVYVPVCEMKGGGQRLISIDAC